MKKAAAHNIRPETGQAMVEFVILLIIIMAVCAGMVASMRLLTFQFWAQQEARYLAFEQTWVPHEFYNDSVDEPLGDLNDGPRFGRPDVVSGRQNDRSVTDDGGLGDLLTLLPQSEGQRAQSQEAIGDIGNRDAPIMLAKNDRPWWKRRTSEWFPKEDGDSSLFVETALANQDTPALRARTDVSLDAPGSDEQPPKTSYQERLRRGVVRLLHNQGFGPKVCEVLRKVVSKHQVPTAIPALNSSDCASRFEEGFGLHLAYNVDIRGFFQTYEGFIQSGFSAPDALETTVRQEVASGFYSFFDGMVAVAQSLAPVEITTDRLDTTATFASSKFANMLSEASYLGSNLALAGILAAAAELGAQNPMGRSPSAALQTEQDLIEILHIDVEEGYLLFPTYLPLPPTFGPVAAGFQSGAMKNVLSQSEDADLRDPLIENSNKMVEVTYQAQGGLFPLATTKIAGAEGATLTARFYLVTQPWHITRRENGTGSYRDKGTQEDTLSDETEEALLRRRVFGLWLFPNDISLLSDPLRTIPVVGDVLAPVLDILGPIGQAAGTIKDFVFDNPFLDFINALADLPLIGGLVPTLPKFPAVRPDAYPGSTELSGSDPEDPDKMAGEEREFEKYLEEQRDFDPEPEPDYN